jgi:uncharacterized protein YciI
MPQPTITKLDILGACQGMLCKDLYVIFTKPTNGLEQVMVNLESHLAFQIELEKQGILFGAGPFFADNESDWLGEGMTIIRAESLLVAQTIAASDPMHVSGARSFVVRPWLLNEGTVTVKISYSDGKRELL